MKALSLLVLVALVACTGSTDAPLSPTAPRFSTAADSVPNLPADVTFTVDSVIDPDHAFITARWTDTNNGTALVDFATPSQWAYYEQFGGLWHFSSSWYGTQTSQQFNLTAKVYDMYVRTRSPYQEAFVMPTYENLVTKVYYSEWSGPVTVDASYPMAGATTLANGKRRKK